MDLHQYLKGELFKMEQDPENEIVELHQFFQDWYNNVLPDTDQNFARFSDVMDNDFTRIDPDGNISVSISAFDYHQYRKSFSFDQLCESTGDIFKRFLEYYKDGREARIVTELKMAR